MKCPANGRECECSHGSITWCECRGIALETARNLNAMPSHNAATLQLLHVFERRSA